MALKGVLGGEPKGLVAIERLRKLPVDVRVKIADFGIARRSGEQIDRDGIAWGTPRYMSPEQARRKSLTPASDIFSLGLLASELVGGVHPLGNSRGIDAIRKLAKGEFELDKSNTTPAPWRKLISRMLDLEPSQRPSAIEIAGEISTIQAHLSGDSTFSMV